MHEAQSIIDRLRKEGHRITAARRRIVEVLCGHHTPLAAPDMERLLRRTGPHVSAATVYRELTFLERLHIARPVRFSDDVTRFELASLPHHHHLVCTRCKRVQDVSLSGELQGVERRIRKQKRFTVSHHALEFYGTCARCA